MTAEQIAKMIARVTEGGRRPSARTVLGAAAAMACLGTRDQSRQRYFNSQEIDKILRYLELEPAAFVGKG